MKHLIAQLETDYRDWTPVVFLPVAVVAHRMDRTDTARADVDADDLLKVVLVLAIVWLLLEIVDTVIGLTFALLNAVPTLLAIVIVVLIVLWLTDRI